MRLLRNLAVLLAALVVSGGKTAFGESIVKGSQFHFRTGPLSTSFAGPVTGSISVTLPYDLEYELFTGAKSSLGFRSIIAYDGSTGRVAYAFAGVSKRTYFWSQGLSYEQNEGATQISAQPKMRYYWGIDGENAQVVVLTFGPVLQAGSALIDVGAHLGTIYQVSRNIGIEGHVGYGKGFGFSSVSVSASTLKTFVGLSYYF